MPCRHPSFCDEILGLFPEENVKGWFAPNFLDCDALRAAVARSFDTWSANHKKIYFTDVTAQCTEATDNVCAAAEVYIYPEREFTVANDLAAYVQIKQDNFNQAPYTTAGLQIQGYGIQSAVMKVRPHDMLHPLVALHLLATLRSLSMLRPLLPCCAHHEGAHARHLLVPRRDLLLPLPRD